MGDVPMYALQAGVTRFHEITLRRQTLEKFPAIAHCSGLWFRRPALPGLSVYTSLYTGELNAIRRHKCFLCSPFYVKGVSLGHVGRIKS